MYLLLVPSRGRLDSASVLGESVVPHGEVVVLEERASSRMFIDFVHCTCTSGVL